MCVKFHIPQSHEKGYFGAPAVIAQGVIRNDHAYEGMLLFINRAARKLLIDMYSEAQPPAG